MNKKELSEAGIRSVKKDGVTCFSVEDIRTKLSGVKIDIDKIDTDKKLGEIIPLENIHKMNDFDKAIAKTLNFKTKEK